MRNFVKLLVISILSVFTLALAAQGTTRRLSLEDACKLAVDSNWQVINARIEIKRTHYQKLEAKSKLYPTLNAYSDLNYYYAIPKTMMPGEIFGESGEIPIEIGMKYDWSSGFKASMPLVNLSNYTAIKLAKNMEAMSALTLEQKKEEILYQLHQLYYLCLSSVSQIGFLCKNMENTDHLLDILENQIKNGTARGIDYSKLTVSKNNLQTQIDNLEKLKVQQCNMLRYILGLDKNTQIELTDSLTEQAILIHNLPDMSGRPDAKIIDNQIETALLNKKTMGQMYLPSLSASGQFYYQGQQNQFNFFDGNKDRFFKAGFVGLSLNIPIFDGFEKQNKIRQYKSEITQLQNTRTNTIKGLEKDYDNALVEYNSSMKAICRQRKNIKVAEANYDISLQQYKQQTLLLSDLILAENSLTEARLSYVDALLQLKNAELELKKLNNELLIR